MAQRCGCCCGSGGGEGGNEPWGNVFPQNVTVGLGQLARVTALSALGIPMTSGVTWRASNNRVSTPGSNGYFSGQNVGTANITASGTASGSARVTVTQTRQRLPSSVTISPSTQPTLFANGTVQLSATLWGEIWGGDGMFLGPTNSLTENRAVHWHSGNTNLATVNPQTGLVRANNAGRYGTVTITATSVTGVIGTRTVQVLAQYDATIRLDHFFDDGFRFINNNNDTAASFRISYYQGHASRIFREAVRLQVRNNIITHRRSSIDDWKGTVTSANLNTVDNNANRNQNRTDYRHFAPAFWNAVPATNTHTFPTFWTGHRTRSWWGNLNHNGTIIDEQGSFHYNRSFIWGPQRWSHIHMVSPQFNQDQMVSLLVHETAHGVGAQDHYCDIVGGVCQNREFCWEHAPVHQRRPRVCNMGDSWVFNKNTHGVTMFCEGCRGDIQTHLRNNH